jgi:hypothetical protein
MKMKHKSLGVLAGLSLALITSCNPLKVDKMNDPNNPSESGFTQNASREQVQFLVTGLEERHRSYVFTATAALGSFGREVWYLNGSDPRFTTDWLGQAVAEPNSSFFGFGNTGGTVFFNPYQAVRQGELLINSVNSAPQVTEAEKGAVAGFARTIQGFQLMLPANLVYDNGIRIDVKEPMNPGPFVSYQEAMNHVKTLLDDGLQQLNKANGAFPFRLTAGFGSYNTVEGLKQVNRAIAARNAVYRKDWQGALDAVNASFMNLSGSLTAGPSHPYGASPDVFNPLFYVPNANVNTMVVVHPSLITDATAGDKRVQDKFFLRTSPVINSTTYAVLEGAYQDKRWVNNSTSVPFIKNEELILIKAEAHAQLGQTAASVEAINVIRNAAGIGNYTGATTAAALINEILYQRRYSLWAEPWGHRWVDARRYDKLSEINVSLDKGKVFKQFPHPQAEIGWENFVK